MDPYKKSQNISYVDTLRGNMEIGVLEKIILGKASVFLKKRIYSVDDFTSIPIKKDISIIF